MSAESLSNPEPIRLTPSVIEYYAAIDEHDLERVFALFDPAIIYLRGSRKIEGLEELKRFYKFDRLPTEGWHELDDMTSEASKVMVQGIYHGQLSSGEQVDINFEDVFVFNANGKIIERFTSFPGREI